MTLAIALITNEQQTTIIATWPRLRLDALAGWLALALLLPLAAVTADAAVGAVIGTVALPAALGALALACVVAVEEMRR